MEKKQISSSTIVTVTNTVDVDIYTFYDQNVLTCQGNTVTDLPNVLQAFISENPGFTGMVGYKEGQLIITAKNFPQLVNFFINDAGRLYISSEDASKYSVDEDTGNLIYTLCDS